LVEDLLQLRRIVHAHQRSLQVVDQYLAHRRRHRGSRRVGPPGDSAAAIVAATICSFTAGISLLLAAAGSLARAATWSTMP